MTGTTGSEPDAPSGRAEATAPTGATAGTLSIRPPVIPAPATSVDGALPSDDASAPQPDQTADDAPAEPHEAAGNVRLSDGLGFGAKVFLAVWAGWALLALIAVAIIPTNGPVSVPGLEAQPYTAGWHNLFIAGNYGDALWYQRIGIDGYRTDDGSAAFFPLYPMAIHALSLLGIGPVAAATFISQVSFFFALVVLYALTAREFGVETARRATPYLAVFPTAFFFLASYTESLFLLLVLLTFWYARADRWAIAVVPAALAATTRSVGVVLVVALLVEAVTQWRSTRRRLAPRLLAALAPAAGTASYFAYWALVHHDVMAPVRAQANWQREWTAPPETLQKAVSLAGQYQSYWLIDLLVVAVPMVALLAGVRILAPAYSAYALVSLLLPLSNPFLPRPLMSAPRFAAVLFPAFWVLAVAVRRRRLSHSLIIGAFSGGYVLLGLLFLNGYHIF